MIIVYVEMCLVSVGLASTLVKVLTYIEEKNSKALRHALKLEKGLFRPVSGDEIP